MVFLSVIAYMVLNPRSSLCETAVSACSRSYSLCRICHAEEEGDRVGEYDVGDVADEADGERETFPLPSGDDIVEF